MDAPGRLHGPGVDYVGADYMDQESIMSKRRFGSLRIMVVG
eukprot:COSAG05_NODE_137_length_16843_cov_121.090779_27_plen_41_part_00